MVAEVFDELAQIVSLVPATATRTTGAGDATVDRPTEQLATALVAH